jgi:hypothetical protein
MNKLTALLSLALALGLCTLLLGIHVGKLPRTTAPEAAAVFRCPASLNVSLDENCRFILSPGIVLGGNYSPCGSAADFRVAVFDSNPSNGEIIDGPGVFRFVVYAWDSSACPAFSPCAGEVRAEDKTPPQVLAPADIALDSFCGGVSGILNAPESLRYTGKAVARDGCGPLSDTLVNFRDHIAYDNRRDTLIIQRTFLGKDRAGNTREATQRILVVRPGLGAVRVRAEVHLDPGCKQERTFRTDSAGNISPTESGYPFLQNDFGDTTFLSPGGACGFSAAYSDHRYALCTQGYQIQRRWTIIDWVSGKTDTVNQVITVGDLSAPLVSCPPAKERLRVSVAPFNCLAVLDIPAPQVVARCSEYDWSAEIWRDSVPWSLSLGGEPGAVPTVLLATSPYRAASRIVSGLPPGRHRIVYKIRDACQNESSATCTVWVEDQISPIAIAKDRIHVSLNSLGKAVVRAEEIDGGSRDNCRMAALELRRKPEAWASTCSPDTSWGREAAFYCCDIGKNIEVELRATDAAGNTNFSRSWVFITDKLPPTCVPPPDTLVDCFDSPTAFGEGDSAALARLFGVPKVSDNCSASFVELPSERDSSDCRNRRIVRRFQAIDQSGNRSATVCTQTITIRKKHSYNLRFPRDFEGQCVEAKPDSIFFQSFGCDLIGVSVREKRYGDDAGACYKIFKTYEVINWCEYDGSSAPVIVPRDADCNGVAGDQETWVLVRPDARVFYDQNADETDQQPAAGSKPTSCDGRSNPKGHWTNSDINPGIRSNGYWQYTQVIRVFDRIAPVIYTDKEVTVCSDQPDCSVEIFIPVGIYEVCSPEVDIRIRVTELVSEYYTSSEITWERYGRFPKYLVAGVVPVGEYTIEIRVTDACQNTAQASVRLHVEDCTAPVPLCYNGLSATLEATPSPVDVDGDGFSDPAIATLYARDFIDTALEACSLPLRYSINRLGEKADINRTALELTCKDVGATPIEVHAWDRAKNPTAIQPDGKLGGPNHGYCTTYVRISDSELKACDTFPRVMPLHGMVASDRGAPVGGVVLQVEGVQKSRAVSEEDGSFVFPALQEGKTYTLVPDKTDDTRSGLTTLDLTMLSQHILGQRKLSNPYQLLAADVNLSNSLTTQDMILLRRVILGLDQQFPHGKTWRFLPRGFPFRDPENPWKEAIPATRIVQMDSVMGAADFTALKLGDLNGSSPAFGQRSLVQGRSAGGMATLSVPDRNLEPGEVFRIPVVLEARAGYAACQFALWADPKAVQWLGAEEGAAGQEQFSLSGERLVLSWDGTVSQNQGSEGPLCWLEGRALQRGPLAQWLRLEPRWLQPEAYPVGEGEEAPHPLQLVFPYESPTSGEGISLEVSPNPTHGDILVNWYLPEAAEVHLSLRDTWGRVVREFRQACREGGHTWHIVDLQLPESGVYILSLNAGGVLCSKKVLYLR